MGKKQDGVKLFHEYYQSIYGDRWDSLYDAMKKPREEYWTLTNDQSQAHLGVHGLVANSNMEGYFIDPASVYAVLALGIKPGDKVLDACSAPGGKALTIMRILSGEGFLQCNERSTQRLRRLKQNMLQFGLYENVGFSQYDSGEPDRTGVLYDKIIVDAPCSSERHWITDGLLADWRRGRAKYLSIIQHRMLCACWERLQVGGTLLYSTCAISDIENDGVITKFLKKRQAEIIQNETAFCATRWGVHIIPDELSGWGPIYYTILRKNNV